jgi:hypothetical protein
VADRLARFAARLAATGAAWDRAPGARAEMLEDAYALAMEVIAREWKPGRGPRGASFGAEASRAARERFADVRENRYVLDASGEGLKPASALLADPGVAATVIYRLAQSKALASRPADPAFYAPFVPGPVPAGISPAALLGSFRNFQAKLLTAWTRASLRGRPPRDVVDLIDAWSADHSGDRGELVRVFIVTTFGGTAKPGGVSPRPQDGAAALAELQALAADVAEGRRSLRDAAGAPAAPAAAPAAR